MKTKKGLLLINLGTPDDPGYLSVFKYLRQFLMDPKVITVPYILRFILVSLIIVPFRAFSSGKIYKKIYFFFFFNDFPKFIGYYSMFF